MLPPSAESGLESLLACSDCDLDDLLPFKLRSLEPLDLLSAGL
jgi:hypothetical protein